MARFRCNRHTCGRPPQGFSFESDLPQCPKCGAMGAPAVHELTDVHFLVMGHGPLTGQFGDFHVACEPERPHLALCGQDGYAATDHPEAVTCPTCMGTQAFQDMVRQLFPRLWRQLEAKRTGKTTVDLAVKKSGDCGCG